MTRKDKVKAIYDMHPDWANDDMKLLLYVLKRQGVEFVDEKKFLEADNPEHWTRAARKVRQEHPELVDEQVKDSRHKEFVDYKYNNKQETYQTYIGEDGMEYVQYG